MSGSAKNLIIILGLATIAFAGYFLYQQQAASALDTTATSDQELEEMLLKTQVFIARRQALDSVVIDDNVLEHEVFVTLKTYTRPVPEIAEGRDTPFDPMVQGVRVSQPVE